MHRPRLIQRLARLLASSGAALLAACGTGPAQRSPAVVMPAPEPAPGARAASVAPAVAPAPRLSQAGDPRAYRQDAAHHIYQRNRERIYGGRLPPMLYAIGVLQVDVDRRGDVQRLNWLRAPRHAPEVVAEIERTVRAAAPFPVPARLGRVTYTDTWLWDRSGRFQLDTLTEGQD